MSNVSDKYHSVKTKKFSLSPVSKRSKANPACGNKEDCYSQIEANFSEEEEDDIRTQSHSIKHVKTFSKKHIRTLRKQHRLNTKTVSLSTTYHHLIKPINTNSHRRSSSVGNNSIHSVNIFTDHSNNESDDESSFSIVTDDIEETANCNATAHLNAGANDIRFSYFTKLITHNPGNRCITTTLQNKSFITKTFIDFDAVFFNMQYIINSKLHKPGTEFTLLQTEQFAKIEFNLLRLLTLALEKGEVVILTNSSLNWVDYSIEKFYPSLLKFKHRVAITSCKSEYERKYPKEPKLWKVKSLLQNLHMTSMNDVTTFKIINCLYFGNLSLNDSDLKLNTHHNVDYVLKMVKTNTSVHLEHLNKQLLLIIKEYMKIYSITSSTTIKIESKVVHQ